MITHRSSNSAGQIVDCLLGHWLLVAGMILVAAALTIPQLDRFGHTHDEFRSFQLATGLASSPYSPLDMLGHLHRESSSQMPLYFLGLFYWSKAVGHSLLALRLLTTFIGLLSLAVVYRLVRDFAAPAAATLAVFILVCNTFYAYYFAHLRHYTLLPLLAALVLWLYLRVVRMPQPRRRDYLALTTACYALISTHAFGFTVYPALAIYHLLAVKKNQRWVLVVASAMSAMLLAIPQLIVLLTAGFEQAQGFHGPQADSLAEILWAWATVNSQGSPLLLGFATAGALIGWRRKLLRNNPFLPLFLLSLVSIAIVSEVTGIVSQGNIRYMLAVMPIAVGFIATGFYALYWLRRWLGLATVLSLTVALSLGQTADYWSFFQPERRKKTTITPAYHLLSREMLQSDKSIPAIMFGLEQTPLKRNDYGLGSFRWFYFDRHGINIQERGTGNLAEYVAPYTVDTPGYWLMYQTIRVDPTLVDSDESVMRELGYTRCDTQESANSVVLLTYLWTSLNCDLEPDAILENSLGSYHSYAARLDESQQRLIFIGEWRAKSEQLPGEHNLSLQLLDADWNSHVQLDLPLAFLDDLRKLYIDLADVPAGDYRLMVVVYDAQTGARQAWRGNEDWIPEMQQLAEISISE
ncbi:MAG: hypothetical protein F4Z94_04370 [Chloroflexi bacterium]|nr:hypothetical protein [Chloroflexota bacterium]